MIRNRSAIVALLTGLNFLNYLDRFVVAAVLPSIQADLGLSNFEGGLLATVFLLGYFATSPIFGALGDRASRKVLIAIGVFTWSLATVASGLADGMLALLAARVVVGVGEASYATLAPTIIDDITPPDKKGKTLAIFFLAVPVGSALGYLVGGFVEHRWGWRAAFYVAGGPGMVLSILCLAIVEPERKLAEAKQRIRDALAKLVRIPLYRRAVFGYCAHTWAIGAFAYWAPKFLNKRYDLSLKDADFTFGVVTVVAGAIGTFLGGALADRWLRGLPVPGPDAGHADVANRLAANAQLRVCAVGVAVAAPAAAIAFLMPGGTAFFTAAGVAEVGLFMSAAPINAIMLRTAPVHMRASAMAIAIFAIHLLGDLWSPPLVGLFLDYLPIVAGMMALPVAFAIGAFVWWPRAHEATDPMPEGAG
ncbi:MAG: MFS transporter [Deltaproteobacteria bacterium]|nr:MFS transporter [Deltaproteobacteria bacterium]MCW5806342.1 MFS transporter [Deltaproteobacteria bacterium]